MEHGDGPAERDGTQFAESGPAGLLHVSHREFKWNSLRDAVHPVAGGCIEEHKRERKIKRQLWKDDYGGGASSRDASSETLDLFAPDAPEQAIGINAQVLEGVARRRNKVRETWAHEVGCRI